MGSPPSTHYDIPLRPRKSGGNSDQVFRAQAGQGGPGISVRNAAQYGKAGLRRAHTVTQGGNTVETKVGRRTGNGRAASLLRVKNSNEVLRQRSLKRSNIPETVPETLPGSREGNHFTVGNVGNNGRLYLRPMITPVPKGVHTAFSRSSVNPSDSALAPPGARVNMESEARHSMWSISQLSELHPGLHRGGNPKARQPDDSERFTAESYHKKAHSCSTITQHQSYPTPQHRGEFRIVIDRSKDRPKSTDERGVPTLEIPIPHYRLGTPQFNSEGSAALRSSVYTGTSVSDNFRSSMMLNGDSYNCTPSIPDANLRPSLEQGRHLSFAASMFSGAAAALSRTSAVTQHSVFYKLKEPIEPFIFDALVIIMDDPSVVRYLPGTKDISAATPARIVAQISSESFMDYELVSDFFLTFRSYLSASNLLSLLLARLQWAIHRLQDDGRIIRIRTFAALRHWILNYFVDDFVINRDLRVQFCDKINSMYDAVKARNGGGTSDLKILIDLKRCWHGRCSLYWDFPDPALDNNPDNPVVAGGVVGSRDINQTALSDAGEPYLGTTVPCEPLNDRPDAFPRSNAAGDEAPPHSVFHTRHVSATTTRSMPISPSSVHSVQAVSCSFPSKSPKRRSSPDFSVAIPHPVPVNPVQFSSTFPGPRSPASFAAQRLPIHTHTHKRSGSFSDSVRDDRAPLSLGNMDAQDQSLMQATPYGGSLIRGNLFAPLEPYVEIIAPPSPTFLSSSVDTLRFDRRSSPDGMLKSTASSPGVRTIIGSIRRALHSRQGGQGISAHAGNTNSVPALRGRTSTLPLNVAFRSELYRDRKTTAVDKSSLRIDLLCDDVMKQYRQALGHSTEKPAHPSEPTQSAWMDTSQEPNLDSKSRSLLAVQPSRETLQSQVSMGSKSIVIVDGTAIDLPVMSGAIPSTSSDQQRRLPHMSGGQSEDTSKIISLDRAWYSSGQADDYALPIHCQEIGSESATGVSRSSQPSDEYPSKRSVSLSRRQSTWRKTESISNRLRKYASYQSVMTRYRPGAGSDMTTSGSGENDTQDDLERPSAHMLRRRPGGDLRKIQKIHDLETQLRPRSFQSGASGTESIADSTLDTGKSSRSASNVRIPPQRPRFSLIQTHSSQNMRPSFEAAVAEFSHIPDDEDGGVESALLKLEGKWDRLSPTATGGLMLGQEERQHFVMEGSGQSDEDEQRMHHHPQIFGRNFTSHPGPSTERHTLSEGHIAHAVIDRPITLRPYSESVAESEDSYSSIPLLERGLSDESMKKPALSPVESDVPSTRSEFSRYASREATQPESSHPSLDIVEETESLRRIPLGSTLPISPTPASFEEDRLSELSSELSVDVIDAEEAVEKPNSPRSTGSQSLTVSALEIPPHPLAHPPSPPMTIQQPGSATSYADPPNALSFQAQPLTPDPSPTHKNTGRGVDRAIDMQQLSNNVLLNSEKGDHRGNASGQPVTGHVPFILGCDSQVLAQQLTLVEKAALSEIDWKDLVDMRWNNSSPVALNWVQFLSEQERKGIDLVVGRFNLMVKWVLSEIVLTQDLQERARAIMKFIHIAAHSRRIYNYSTMLQIAIALSSIDCTRLTRTWALVTPADRNLLKEMESLIQPVRNFHELRVEMETANLQEGCIPFVGLYVHDLTYNAQKPAQIASTRDGEPLVNFERYRTAAKIVKSLLRLVDASTKYAFEPVHGVLERCLWIAALSDEQIQTMSKRLQ